MKQNKTRTDSGRLLAAIVALVLTVALAPTAVRAQASTPPAASARSSAPAAIPATPEERAGYAEREAAAAPELSAFEGGDTVLIISTGAALLILAIVLLIVLL